MREEGEGGEKVRRVDDHIHTGSLHFAVHFLVI